MLRKPEDTKQKGKFIANQKQKAEPKTNQKAEQKAPVGMNEEATPPAKNEKAQVEKAPAAKKPPVKRKTKKAE